MEYSFHLQVGVPETRSLLRLSDDNRDREKVLGIVRNGKVRLA